MNQPQLYDTPKKLNVETFYKIMKTGNLSLLKVNSNDDVSIDVLNDVWLDIQEYYYSHTNQNSFDLFKRNIKNVVSIQSEIIACYAALELAKIGDERSVELLTKLGISSTEINQIESAIRRKETKLEFAKNKLDRGQKKEADVSFYRILASVERRLERSLNIQDYNLERWVEMLADLHEKEEVEKQHYEKLKSKRHGR